jgi:uroporphyrin-III C-methyltransferase
MRASHLLPETARVLQASRQVLYLSHVPGVRSILESYNENVTDLLPLYKEQVDRLATYKEIAAAVIDAALKHPPVALAVYGHPLVLSVPSTILLRLGPDFGLRVKALPAISALDCLLADLGVDLVAIGVQVHEATDVLLYQRRLMPELATVLWQVGVLENRSYAENARSNPIQLSRLRDHLQKYYTPGHEVVAISSSVDEVSEPEVHRFRLHDLAAMADLLHLGTTIYIPPVPGKPPQA